MTTTVPVLILPGLGGSGPTHWQSLWEATNPAMRRVVQRDWKNPDLSEWLATLQRCIAACEVAPVLVAHSLACSLVAHWVVKFGHGVAAALLVSPSDVESPDHTPPSVRGFAPIPLIRFPFPSIVVASTNDRRVEFSRAIFFASSWGSRFVAVSEAGHINETAGLGAWPEGRQLLGELLHAA